MNMEEMQLSHSELPRRSSIELRGADVLKLMSEETYRAIKQKYELKKLIGNGTFGTVFLVSAKKHGKLFALKVIADIFES